MHGLLTNNLRMNFRLVCASYQKWLTKVQEGSAGVMDSPRVDARSKIVLFVGGDRCDLPTMAGNKVDKGVVNLPV